MAEKLREIKELTFHFSVRSISSAFPNFINGMNPKRVLTLKQKGQIVGPCLPKGHVLLAGEKV